jgi:hypothetical protein
MYEIFHAKNLSDTMKLYNAIPRLYTVSADKEERIIPSQEFAQIPAQPRETGRSRQICKAGRWLPASPICRVWWDDQDSGEPHPDAANQDITPAGRYD